LPVFDLLTGQRVGSYPLTKCRHWSPAPRAGQ
jgi:hypothetical protein